jgi:hypothetical protein
MKRKLDLEKELFEIWQILGHFFPNKTFIIP